MRMMVIILIALGLAGCAFSPESDLRVAEIYKRHASEEAVNGVRYTSVRGWRPVGKEGVLIEFDRQRYYLFTLTRACRSEIQFAQTIAFSPTPVSRIDRFDRIALDNRWCWIEEIREVDFKAVEAELAALNHSLDPQREPGKAEASPVEDHSRGT